MSISDQAKYQSSFKENNLSFLFLGLGLVIFKQYNFDSQQKNCSLVG